MEGAGGDEPDIERRRRRRHHPERVLHAHEEEDPHCEEAGYPMVFGHVDGVMQPPRHEGGLAAAVETDLLGLRRRIHRLLVVVCGRRGNDANGLAVWDPFVPRLEG